MADASVPGAGLSAVAENSRFLSNEEKANRRKTSYVRRDSSRINLLDCFPRWRELRDQLCLSKDKDLAEFLMDFYAKEQNHFRDPVDQSTCPPSSPATCTPLRDQPTQLHPLMTSTPTATGNETRRSLRLLSMTSPSPSPVKSVSFQRQAPLGEDTLTASEGDTLVGDTEMGSHYISSFRVQSFDEEETLTPSDSDEEEMFEPINPVLPTIKEMSRLDVSNLERASVEVEVHDVSIDGHDDSDGHEEQEEPSQADGKAAVVTSKDAIAMEKCIVFTEHIMSLLLQLHGKKCRRSGCERDYSYKKTYVGTCLVVSWQCIVLVILAEDGPPNQHVTI